MTGSSKAVGSPVLVFLVAAAALLVGLGAGPEVARAQDRAAEGVYLRLVSEEFRVPEDEARDLIRSGARIEELPVLFRLSRQSGISPAVLLALRRRGNSWVGVAGRYQLGAGTFYVQIPTDQVDDRIRRAHELFRDTPQARWNTLALSDEEVVVLANVYLLTRSTGRSPGQVLEARVRAGSFPEAARLLVGR